MADKRQDGLWIQGLAGNMNLADEATQQIPGELGKVTFIQGTLGMQAFQKVKRSQTDATAPTTGAVAYWADLSNYTVVAATTGALGGAVNPVVAGVFLSAVPSTSQYGYIQVAGPVNAKVTGTGVVGAKLIAATTEAVFKASGSQTNEVDQVGAGFVVQAFTTATGTTRTVFLAPPRNGW
jgi:hypothetical protein